MYIYIKYIYTIYIQIISHPNLALIKDVNTMQFTNIKEVKICSTNICN